MLLQNFQTRAVISNISREHLYLALLKLFEHLKLSESVVQLN